MPKHSHREQILTEGLRVVHERGFAGASVRDIVKAAGVPQGSFTNHFSSKEMFGLEILDRYFAQARTCLAKTLRNDEVPPLQRLRAYADAADQALEKSDMRFGCLIGNFSIEASEHSDLIRGRLIEIFEEIKQALSYCLQAAVEAGELPATTDVAAFADFYISGLQGATLRSKAERSAAPVKNFKKMMFSHFLAPLPAVGEPEKTG